MVCNHIFDVNQYLQICILNSKINLVFWDFRYDHHIYEEIPCRIGNPSNEERGCHQSIDINPDVYSIIEELSPNARTTVSEEIKDETDNLIHANQGNQFQGIVVYLVTA